MAFLNENYLDLKPSYLFSDIAKRVNKFVEENPKANIIRLGIGDVTEPLPKTCLKAFHDAVTEMGDRSSFKGYGPEQGYGFLRDAIAKNDYQARGVDISSDEIFVSDGSKCDTGNFQEMFSSETRVAIPDPVYPVYLDTTVMIGRAGKENDGRYGDVTYLDVTEANGFTPDFPSRDVDLIFLCSPNNPTGATISREDLTKWVAYAKEKKAIILFDAAYFAFVQDKDVPLSIYEIPGAKEVAVEFRSFSKTAGFTGTRCAFTVVPKECMLYSKSGEKVSLHGLWLRRQSTKFNGVSYPVQKAAEAIYTEEGKKEVQALISYYMGNAKKLRNLFESKGYACAGGENAPYVWVNTGGSSWDFFDKLMNQAQVVCTPGVGFGKCGEGYVRFSAFNSSEKVDEAIERIKGIL